MLRACAGPPAAVSTGHAGRSCFGSCDGGETARHCRLHPRVYSLSVIRKKFRLVYVNNISDSPETSVLPSDLQSPTVLCASGRGPLPASVLGPDTCLKGRPGWGGLGGHSLWRVGPQVGRLSAICVGGEGLRESFALQFIFLLNYLFGFFFFLFQFHCKSCLHVKALFSCFLNVFIFLISRI